MTVILTSQPALLRTCIELQVDTNRHIPTHYYTSNQDGSPCCSLGLRASGKHPLEHRHVYTANLSPESLPLLEGGDSQIQTSPTSFILRTSQKNHAQQTRIRNLLLEKLFWPFGIDTSTLQTNSTEDETTIRARIAYKKPMYAHKEANWQRMLIQQPPTSTIGFFPGCENGPYSRRPDGMRLYVMDVYSSDTIEHGKIRLRMGDLYHSLYTNGLACYDDKWVFWYQNPDILDFVIREILPEWDCDAMIKRAIGECDIIVSAWFMFGVTFPRRYNEGYNRRLDGFEQQVNKLLDDYPDYEPTASWVMNGDR